MFPGAGDEADHVDHLAGTGRTVAPDVVEAGAGDRILLVELRPAGTEQLVGEAGHPVVGADDAEVFRARGEPGAGEAGADRALEPFDDRADPVVRSRARGRAPRGRALGFRGGGASRERARPALTGPSNRSMIEQTWSCSSGRAGTTQAEPRD